MFTYPISASGTGILSVPSGSAVPAGGFEEVLDGAMSIQPGAGASGKQKPDPVDEDKALRELFHLLAMLSLGQIDYGALAKDEGTSGVQPGPMRMEVERLKELLRRFLRGERGDLQTGGGDGSEDSKEVSLEDLFRSLPTEIQNLLRRAFPALDQMLLEDRRGKKTEGATPDAAAGGQGTGTTATILGRILDASNLASAARSAEERAATGR